MFTLFVSDNGKGFKLEPVSDPDPSTNPSGDGLEQHGCAGWADIGGRCKIDSAPGRRNPGHVSWFP